jgi:hypothetical protein
MVDKAGYQTPLFKVTSAPKNHRFPKQSAVYPNVYQTWICWIKTCIYTNTHFDPEDGDSIAHIHGAKPNENEHLQRTTVET